MVFTNPARIADALYISLFQSYSFYSRRMFCCLLEKHSGADILENGDEFEEVNRINIVHLIWFKYFYHLPLLSYGKNFIRCVITSAKSA